MGKGAIITRKIKEDIRYIFEEEERYNNKNWENSGFFFRKNFLKIFHHVIFIIINS